jgi:predicted metal-binding protein
MNSALNISTLSGTACLETEVPLPRIEDLAMSCGFTHTGELKAETLRVRPEVRDACAADKCRSYGKNWSCPPACGSLEECEKRIRKHRGGLILQTSGVLEDSLDYEGMQKIGRDHGKNLKTFQAKVKELLPDYLLLGSGACKNCETCTCPAEPCRFPDKMIISMEAMGLVVSDVCRENGLPYYYGTNTLTYVGCVLF